MTVRVGFFNMDDPLENPAVIENQPASSTLLLVGGVAAALIGGVFFWSRRRREAAPAPTQSFPVVIIPTTPPERQPVDIPTEDQVLSAITQAQQEGGFTTFDEAIRRVGQILRPSSGWVGTLTTEQLRIVDQIETEIAQLSMRDPSAWTDNSRRVFGFYWMESLDALGQCRDVVGFEQRRICVANIMFPALDWPPTGEGVPLQWMDTFWDRLVRDLVTTGQPVPA